MIPRSPKMESNARMNDSLLTNRFLIGSTIKIPILSRLIKVNLGLGPTSLASQAIHYTLKKFFPNSLPHSVGFQLVLAAPVEWAPWQQTRSAVTALDYAASSPGGNAPSASDSSFKTAAFSCSPRRFLTVKLYQARCRPQK